MRGSIQVAGGRAELTGNEGRGSVVRVTIKTNLPFHPHSLATCDRTRELGFVSGFSQDPERLVHIVSITLTKAPGGRAAYLRVALAGTVDEPTTTTGKVIAWKF